MARLEDLTRGAAIRSILPDGLVTVVDVHWYGTSVVELTYCVPQMLACIQRKSGRQVLLSTHSADLLRDQGIGLDEMLLLPDAEGTNIRPVSSFNEIKTLLDSGFSMADAVIPRTRPVRPEQLAPFEG